MTSEDEVLNNIEDPELAFKVKDAWDQDLYLPMPCDDPAQFLVGLKHFSTPTVYSAKCYICNDPEFAMMGLPLCYKCDQCEGHIPADDAVCDDCGWDAHEAWEREHDREILEEVGPIPYADAFTIDDLIKKVEKDD